MARTALIKTTTASQRDCSSFSTVTGIAITADIPTGCDMRFGVKVDDGTYKKYDTSTSAWKDLTTQDMTAATLLSEGNTKAELEALTSTALAPMAGNTVNFAVAILMGDTATASPSITSVKISGATGSTVTQETVESDAITLSESDGAVEILSIDVSKTEVSGGTVSLLASIQDAGGTWGAYADYTKFVTSPAATAKAVKFKAVLNAPTPGTSIAKINSVSIKHRTDNVAVFSEGTGVCITKTYDFVNTIGRAHLMVKHPIVQDTEISAFVSLREPPSYVTGEVLGTGDGAQHTVKLAHADNLASHGFVLYFDGNVQSAANYSYSPTDGQVTYTAPKGETVTTDYIHGWSAETFVPMEHDTQYPDKNDNSLVDDQYDYVATKDTDPKGSVGTVKVSLKQNTGTEKNVSLGTATGEQQSFKLAHHAKPETIVVTPATAVWKYKDNTDVLLVTGSKGDSLAVSYDWAARTNYLESLACIFNE